MKFLIEELSSNDSLALVLFDTNVQQLFNLTKMDEIGKQMAHSLLESVKTGSSTNLSGGLFKGIELLIESSKSRNDKLKIEPTRSIMLLTDGAVNAGITDLKQLINMSKKMMENIIGGESTSIHCFGFGADADVPFCTGISEACHGMFYAVNEIDQVSTAFGNCIGGLLAVSAQNIKLSFTPNSPHVEIKEVMTKFENTKDQTTGIITVSIPDMYSEECRDILYKVIIGPLPKNSTSEIMIIGKFMITFMDVKYEKLNKIEKDCFILRPKVLSSIEAGVQNEDILKHLMRIEGAKTLEEAKKLADSGQFDLAKKTIEATRDKMILRGINEDENSMLGSMMNDLSESSAYMDSATNYNVIGKSKLSSKMATHNFQRSNAVSSIEASNNAYQTKSRMDITNKAFMSMPNFQKPTQPSKPQSPSIPISSTTTLPLASIAAPNQATSPSTTTKKSSSSSTNLFRRLSNSFKSISQSSSDTSKTTDTQPKKT